MIKQAVALILRFGDDCIHELGVSSLIKKIYYYYLFSLFFNNLHCLSTNFCSSSCFTSLDCLTFYANDMQIISEFYENYMQIFVILNIHSITFTSSTLLLQHRSSAFVATR